MIDQARGPTSTLAGGKNSKKKVRASGTVDPRGEGPNVYTFTNSGPFVLHMARAVIGFCLRLV